MTKLSVINGKMVGRKRTHVSAPSPAEIAGRAYDRATLVAAQWAIVHAGEAGPRLQAHLELHRDTQLAALREEVIKGKR